MVATRGKDRGLPPETRNCEESSFLTEQDVIFFLSFLYTPCCSLPSLNCNECAEVVHKLRVGGIPRNICANSFLRGKSAVLGAQERKRVI